MIFKTKNRISKDLEINEEQQQYFNKLTQIFDPPFPEGVMERLCQIVQIGKIKSNSIVLDVGTGTGVLIPIINNYLPKTIWACDLSSEMLKIVNSRYPKVKTILGDVSFIPSTEIIDNSVDVIFLNACYPNIINKDSCFKNLKRMMKTVGKIIISHPLGKKCIDDLREIITFPLDSFPQQCEVESLFYDYGLKMDYFLDENELYILVLTLV